MSNPFYINNGPFNISEILEILEIEMKIDKNRSIKDIQDLYNADKDYIKVLKLISINKIFKKDHLVIIHREKNSKENLEKILEILFIKDYGRSRIIFGTFI